MRVKHFFSVGYLIVAGAIVAACGVVLPEAEDSDGKSEEPILNEQGEEVVEFGGTLALAGATGLVAVKVTDLVAYCVSFTDDPDSVKAEFAENDDGKAEFKMLLRKGVPYGCFINNKDGDTVATILRSTDEAGFGGGEGKDSSLGFNGNVVGLELVLDLETGEVIIPKEALVGLIIEISQELLGGENAALLDRIHNKNYRMECVEASRQVDPKQAEACRKFLEDSPSVGFRIIKGDQEGKPIYGLGVWKDIEAFNSCGGVDMSTETADELKGQGIEFSQNEVGDYTLGEGCNERKEEDGGGEDRKDSDRLEDYFALEKLNPKARGSWGMEQFHHEEHDGCERFHALSIVFSEIKDSDSFAGMFRIADGMKGENCNWDDHKDGDHNDGDPQNPEESKNLVEDQIDENNPPEGDHHDGKDGDHYDGDGDNGEGDRHGFNAQFPVRFVPIDAE